MSTMRTHSCGALRREHVGQTVRLCGWVWRRRDHGGAIFIDLRDRFGVTQVVFQEGTDRAAHALASDLRSEYCIGIEGTVAARGANENPKLPTGAIEVNVTKLELHSRAETPPFAIEDDLDTNEALRLKHRYLDL